MTWQLCPFVLKNKTGAENLPAWLCSAGVFLCNNHCDMIAHCQIRHKNFEHLESSHRTTAFPLFVCLSGLSGYPDLGPSVLALSPEFVSNNSLLFCWCFTLNSLPLKQPYRVKQDLSMKGLVVVFWNYYGVLLQWRRQIRAIGLNAELLLPATWICTVTHQVRDGFWIKICTLVHRRMTVVETNEMRKLSCNRLIFICLI